ncbi:D-alanyl-D-alanine carboxypeptidase [Streptomyces sp. NBC_01216]|uniref:D-alanyl-D-alanine carboxypeptidase n=1 Tax=Streptomyces sp. NBC_01216 TaxID=2903778 RepID=UPI002E0F1178|nr:D-alanyl-D-alanine carboxypeptidase [Streptomyces sp. NBC_01216]
MTHGGGMVAGESPDKAEQQESPRGAAPGGGARDPRLSVLRETEGASAAPETAPAVRVDQPTAVFANLAPRTPEDDVRSVPEQETAIDGAAAEAAGDAQAGTGDRLRAAVAAWVASGDEERARGPEKTTEESAEESAERPAGKPDGGRTAGDGSVAAAGDTADTEADAEADTEADAEADDAVEDVDRADHGDEPAVEDGPAEGGPAAVARTSGDDRDAGDASEESASEESASEPSASEESASEPSASEESASEPSASEPSASAGAGSEEPAPAASASEEPVRAVVAPVASADSWFSARKPAAAAEPAAAEPTAATAPEHAEPAVASSADDPADGAPAVDQPTAVFKAVRPAAVDQPTTALKLPPTPPPSREPDAGGKAGPSRDSAPAPAPPSDGPTPSAERPSTFVPLRKDVRHTPAATPAPETDTGTPVAPRIQVPAPAPDAPASLTEPERTKQQPMPPLPPLDLLAELTNTPPPAPTPLRTTVRRVRIWTPLVILLLIVFAIVQFVRPLPEPVLGLTADPAYTFEGGDLNMPWPSEGQGAAEVEGVGSLGTYGAQRPAPIASVAKTMTAYVILRDHPIKGKESGPEIEVDQKAGEQAKAKDESTAPIKKGQFYSEKELLQLLMIPSGNNVARLLARWDAGSEAAFVEKMNAAAKDLGMTDSVYTDPSGLESTTVSTPLDQLKLAKAVMQNDVFREIVNMPNLTVDGIPGRIENNNNILLKPGVGGIKTGSSTPAGGNLLWSANTVVDGKNRRILGVVMGAKNADQLYKKLQLAIDYSLELIRKAQADVTSATVVRKGQVVGRIDDGLGGSTPVVATEELKAIGWPGLEVRLRLTDGGTTVPHSGKAGDVVGEISIGTGAGRVTAPVALQKDLVEPGFDRKLTRLG